MTVSEKTQDGTNADPLLLIDPTIRQYFLEHLKHKQLTSVQNPHPVVINCLNGVKMVAKKHWVYDAVNYINERIPAFNEIFDKACTLRHMLHNFDCVVQAPTGSGKSLAFLLPVLQLLLLRNRKECLPEMNECQILAMVVAPGRELVIQLWNLFAPICKLLKFNALKLHGAGGARKKHAMDIKKHLKGQCILICTPGRFEHYLEKERVMKNYLKHLEVLIIDEADRYSDRESMRSLTTLLSALPKQRRTALFSATQATGIEQLLRFGLRNPIRLNVAGQKVEMDTKGFNVLENMEDLQENDEENAQARLEVMPKELTNYYACVTAEMKFLAMIKFLRSQKEAKVLVFVSNASQAEYFSMIVPPLLDNSKNPRPIISLHRKMNQQRQKVLERFRATPRCVLFTTDILARGIDVVDIDWVLQYDFPKLSRLFIHRSGRSGRMGRAGQSLLLLMPEEEAYVAFIRRHESVKLEGCEFGGLTGQKAIELRERIQQMSIEDRKILELGSSAFVSYIEAYTRHDCQVICKLKSLNIVGIANAFGLLRLPRLREFQQRPELLQEFRTRTDVRTSEIKFKSPELEAKRQMKKAEEREKQKRGERTQKVVKFGQKENEEDKIVDEKEKPQEKKKRKKSEWEQLQREESLLKKFKKGKLNRLELEEQMDEIE